MKPVRGESKDDIAGPYTFAGDLRAALHRAHRKSRQVILGLRVEAGQFGCFPSDESATGLDAGVCDAVDDRFPGDRIKFSRCQVVEKEERFGTLNDKVVHALATRSIPTV